MDAILNINVVPFLVLLFPLAGFTVLALFGDAIKRDKEDQGAGILACVMVVLSFLCAAWVALKLPAAAAELARMRQEAGLGEAAGPYMPYGPSLFARPDGFYLNWIDVGGLRVPFSLLLDQLSSLMMLTVSGVGALIHIYSLGYMAHDPERVRYFSYLNLFTFFMLLLVMGGSLPLLFVGWEGVGLCSYLLIGFWYRKQSASDAGKKAFIVNRIGDAGLLLGMFLAFHSVGSLDLLDLTEAAERLPAEALGSFGVVTAICLLLFLGACGKSAQIPLHVWLPDAMEGPTPVSALIHAATMVTAGVYMVARLAPLYAKSETALLVVASVGAVTAFVAATIAIVQTDIKRVLAYSTVSQLGYMFLACGLGAFGVAVFHLFTHAFFKALLFLASGSVIHAMSGEQDMRKMGGLARKIPWTYGTMAVGVAAIAGVPFLAGYYSKDEILAYALASGRPWLLGIACLTAVLTAFYMMRLLVLTFWGAFRGDHETEHHVHESPWTMLGPLVILAAGCFVVGQLHVPQFLEPVFRLEPHEAPHFPVWAALGIAALGLLSAGYVYTLFQDVPDKAAAAGRPLYRLFVAKYYFDHVYDWLAARVVVGGSDSVLWRAFDAGVIDGSVNGAAALVAGASRAVRVLQTGFVRAYVLLIFGGAVALLSYVLWLR